MNLPIHELRTEFDAALQSQSRLVIEAPTGSGKSTQVPQWLIDLVPDDILVLQPRRLAARMLATRVAQERGQRVGGEIGYRIRLENRTSAETRVAYITEGILLRQLLGDSKLSGVSAVVFDEFHERNLYTDLALARLRELQRTTRPDLKMVVMSATLDATQLIEYLAPCRRIVSEGRTYPVDIRFSTVGTTRGRGAPVVPSRTPEVPVWDRAARAFEAMAHAQPEGHILVFMPGAYEIRRTIEAIRHTSASRDFEVMPLHGELSASDQDRAVDAFGGRKVVVSTNVAETSLTIDNVRGVIDSGLARMARFDPYRRFNTLTIQKISRASADQRAGRAGRTAPGMCMRLWNEREHARREPQTPPEVRRVDLSEALLSLAGGGFDPETFPWFEAPDEVRLQAGIDLLQHLGAIAEDGGINLLGKRMLAFPLHPRFARLLLAADDLGCVPEAALAAAMAQGRPFWMRKQPASVEKARQVWMPDDPTCDFTPLFRAWQWARDQRFDLAACEARGLHAGSAREVDRLFRQILDIAERQGLTVKGPGASESALRRCLLRAFSDQLAVRRDKGTTRCRLSGNRGGKLADECHVRNADLLVATEIHEIEGKDLNVLLDRAAAVKMHWLEQDFPHLLHLEEEAGFDRKTRRVTCEQRILFGDLVLETRPGTEPSDETAAAFLAREIHAGELKLKTWNEKVESWIARVNTLAELVPDLGYTAITGEDRILILEQICLGARSFREVRDRSPWDELKSWLAPGLADRLDYFAPERIKLVSGRQGRVRYATGEPPTLSAKLQDLYDTTGRISIAKGRIHCRIEILAPNQRPVQITDQLDTFWEEGYPLVKKDLKGRYPKHEWR